MSKRVRKVSGIKAQLPLAVRSGKYSVGYKQAIRDIVSKRAKCLVVAANLPKIMRAKLEYYCMLAKGIPIKFFDGSNNKLATLMGLDFRASVVSITDQGESDILEVETSE